MPADDGRSVGELLLHADVTARGLLFDAPDPDAAGMVRCFGQAVEAAGEVWELLPVVNPEGASARRDTVVMDTLVQRCGRLHGVGRRLGWSGVAPEHPGMSEVVDTLALAGEVLMRNPSTARARAWDPAVAADIAAARSRIVHTLYLSAHATALAVGAHVQGLEAQGPQTPGLYASGDVLRRIERMETIAGAYAGRTLASAAGGQVTRPNGDTVRLQEAIAAWDVHAHRALAAGPAPATMAHLARVQGYLTTSAAIVAYAAAVTGAIDGDQYRNRLSPALDEAQAAWSHLADGWAQLVPVTGRPDPAVVAADRELYAAVRDLAHDKTAWATPDALARRVDLGQAVGAFGDALDCGVDLAQEMTTLTASRQVFLAPARVVATVTIQYACPGVGPAAGPDASPVTVSAVHANRAVPITGPIRARLADAGEATLIASGRAATCTASWLDSATQAGSADPVTRDAPHACHKDRRHHITSPLPKRPPRTPGI